MTKANLEGVLEEAIASRNELREALETHSVARITWESTRTELDAALGEAQEELQNSVGHLTGERSAWAGRRHDLEARIIEAASRRQCRCEPSDGIGDLALQAPGVQRAM